MIYDYEATILNYVNKCIPSIREATYAKEEDLLRILTSITKYPAFFYSRSESEYGFPKTFKVQAEEFLPIEQIYTARVITANVKEALLICSKLRFYCQHNPYLFIKWKGEQIKIALRFLYIKVTDERDNSNTKGPKRVVEWSWRSNLFLDYEDTKYGDSLVEEVRIHLTTDGTTELTDFNNNLISIINERSIPID